MSSPLNNPLNRSFLNQYSYDSHLLTCVSKFLNPRDRVVALDSLSRCGNQKAQPDFRKEIRDASVSYKTYLQNVDLDTEAFWLIDQFRKLKPIERPRFWKMLCDVIRESNRRPMDRRTIEHINIVASGFNSKYTLRCLLDNMGSILLDVDVVDGRRCLKCLGPESIKYLVSTFNTDQRRRFEFPQYLLEPLLKSPDISFPELFLSIAGNIRCSAEFLREILQSERIGELGERIDEYFTGAMLTALGMYRQLQWYRRPNSDALKELEKAEILLRYLLDNHIRISPNGLANCRRILDFCEQHEEGTIMRIELNTIHKNIKKLLPLSCTIL